MYTCAADSCILYMYNLLVHVYICIHDKIFSTLLLNLYFSAFRVAIPKVYGFHMLIRPICIASFLATEQPSVQSVSPVSQRLWVGFLFSFLLQN